MAARLDKGDAFLRHIGVALALCVTIFAAASYSISFLQVAQGISGFWLPNGLALVALLRAPRREWPLLVAAALAGNVAAGFLAQNSSGAYVLIRSGVSAVQYCLCAEVLRRRLGEYFDLLEPRHLGWLAAVGAVTTVLKIALQIAWLDLIPRGSTMNWLEILTWTFNNFLGLFVLSLPLLAITARSAFQSAKPDRIGVALLAVLIGELALIFGPVGFPGVYILMPVLMLLAWRHGLFGSGLGTMITVLVVGAFSIYGSGLQSTLIAAGYSPVERGTYMELFCSVTILTSLPLAVARARQLAMDAALTTAENRWRAALEGSGLGVWDWNMAARTVYYSKVWKAIRGFGEDEIGTDDADWRDRIHPDDMATARSAALSHLDGQSQFYEIEYRARCKDGRYRWVLDRGTVVERAADGSALRMIGTSTDIDALKQSAERAERHSSLYIALAECNAALARRGSIEELGATICEILVESGRMQMAWIGMVDPANGLFVPVATSSAEPSGDYLSGVDISSRAEDPNGQGAMGRAFRGNESLWVDQFATDPRTEKWRDRADTLGWVGGAALPLRRNGTPVGILSIYTDQADYFDQNTRTLLSDMAAQFSLVLDTLDAEDTARQYQESLSMSEQRFRTMFETAPLGIALMDTLDGHFLTVNPMYETIIGWSSEELLGKTWPEVTHPDDLTRDQSLAALFIAEKSTGYQFEKRYIRKDGNPVWVHMTITRFALPGTERRQHLCMIEDITERKALETRIQFVQQMEAIGQLTGGVAHDFNNLLTIVIGSSEALAEQLAQPQQRKLASLILQAAEQGSELIRRLLAFARQQPLEPHAFDVNKLLESMARLIKRALGANLQFSIVTASDLHIAFADPAPTQSAILNLCLNARDAMPDGGKLTVSTLNVTVDEDQARRQPDAQPGSYVAIRISDTGTGIAPEVLKRIFEPFFTTKETGKGSGLGLSMVYGFVQQSQGFVDVTSEVGKGTAITIHLPAAETEADLIVVPGSGEAIERGSENVLIVEDNDLVREHARSQFESLGYTVSVASTGAEALALLEQREDFDLLFTDIVMPGGMTGRQLGERAVERWPWLRVLYTSGYSKDALTQDGRLLDDVTLLSKPYSKRELSEKARKVLDEVP